jgi:inorganic pyrophosphatase
MDINKIAIGKNPPHEINVIIEIPMGGDPIKHEIDKDSGALFVDRITHAGMRYPCNYGFVPHTLSEDGDPVDVLVVAPYQFYPTSVVRCRPIGVLMTEDEKGGDEKILAVPVEKVLPHYAAIKDYTDLPEIARQEIQHFYEHYKDLEKGKWVKVTEWRDAKAAEAVILEAIERNKK